MAELQIIGGPQSNFVWTTRIVCAEKGVPYQHISVMPHTPEVDAIHPFGKIPVMRHGDVTLCESRAIISYIDRTFDGPSLTPRDPGPVPTPPVLSPLWRGPSVSPGARSTAPGC